MEVHQAGVAPFGPHFFGENRVADGSGSVAVFTTLASLRNEKAARNDPPSGPIIYRAQKQTPARRPRLAGVAPFRWRSIPARGLGSRPNGTGSVSVFAKLAIRLGIPNKQKGRPECPERLR